jgi:hypothetical protein
MDTVNIPESTYDVGRCDSEKWIKDDDDAFAPPDGVSIWDNEGYAAVGLEIGSGFGCIHWEKKSA